MRSSMPASPGVHFAVWAPNAARVSVVGDFNGWDGRRNPMRRRGGVGVWEIFIPGARRRGGLQVRAARRRRLAAAAEGRPGRHRRRAAAAERLGRPPRRRLHLERRGLAGRRRAAAQSVTAPISILEVHLGSWARGEGNRFLTYDELAERLIPYAVDMGFTHLELLPVNEHPFDGSWGYQPIGLFAPTSRHGTPARFRPLRRPLPCRRAWAVLLDWVPGHFPTDAHGLGRFDGTALYEHADPRQGFHQDWSTLIYNFGRTRGDQLPARQRAVLARPLPCRRPAGRCGGLDALPRLFAQGRTSGSPTSSAGARTWRRSTSCAG